MSQFQIDMRPAYDRLGKITPMVRSGGYVMVRRPRAMPFVLTEKDWRKLPKSEEEGNGWQATHSGVERSSS